MLIRAEARAAELVGFNFFDQNIPPSLVTAMCSFHSFCRLFGPTCFTGIDTYINIYINIYESIFLSSYT